MADAQGESREVSRDEARKLIDEGAQLVDVRADHEWEVGRIAGADHVPLPELPQRLDEIDKDRPVVVYCRGGNRSTMATDALAEAGYDAAKQALQQAQGSLRNIRAVDIVSTGIRGENLDEYRAHFRVAFLIEGTEVD